MRKHGKVDANHTAIVKALRQVGATVQSLASVGGGCPDLLVGRQGMTYLLEVKDGAKKPSERKLTADELAWHLKWRGQVHVVESEKDALAAIGLEPSPGIV